MGQTTRMSLPYPEGNEPPNIPLDMKELAESLAGISAGWLPSNTKANRPAPVAVLDRHLFYAHDTKETFICVDPGNDGSWTWTSVGSGSIKVQPDDPALADPSLEDGMMWFDKDAAEPQWAFDASVIKTGVIAQEHLDFTGYATDLELAAGLDGLAADAVLDGDLDASVAALIAEGAPPSLVRAALRAIPGAQVDVFDVSGTWTKPVGAVSVHTLVVAAGGSGHASPTTNGGGGGYGGNACRFTNPAAEMPATVTVTIGAGGAARPGGTGDGYPGGFSLFGAVRVDGGPGGVGYNSASPTWPSGAGMFYGGKGGQWGSEGGLGYGGAGGGGSAKVGSSPPARAGGASMDSLGGAPGQDAPVAIGAGGGGGGGDETHDGGDGVNGGGGGGSRDNRPSGAGGNGVVVVITYF